MAGLRLPIESHVLQAFVSEAIKPLIPGVITFGAGHFYISQSDKGGLVFGGDLDGYNSYAQRGNLPTVEDVCESGMALMPSIGRVRMLRSWGGIMDMSMDGSPIIDRTPLAGLYLNAGWCYGGFKATPAVGLVFRASARARRVARGRARVSARPLRDGSSHRREGAGRAAQSALMRIVMSLSAASGTRVNSPIWAMPPTGARMPARPMRRRSSSSAVVSARQPGRAARGALVSRRRLPQLAARDARHAHARDLSAAVYAMQGGAGMSARAAEPACRAAA